MPRRLTSKQDMEERKKEERKEPGSSSAYVSMDDLAREREGPDPRDPDWLLGFMPGSRESVIARALVVGFPPDDKDSFADALDTDRRTVRCVERTLKGLGFTREVVVRYRPPADRMDAFRYERRSANAEPGSLPF